MRRALWTIAAIVVVAAVAGAVVAIRPTSTSPEDSTLADVQAALILLSEMPAGTTPITFVGNGGSASCTESQPRVAPLVHAQASYAERLGPTTSGPPSEIESLYEVVSVYAEGTAAQRMNDLRVPQRCPSETVAPLDFPRVASDQLSVQRTVANVGRIDFVYLRVNTSAILAIAAEAPTVAPIVRMEAFAREAYSRARSKLGG